MIGAVGALAAFLAAALWTTPGAAASDCLLNHRMGLLTLHEFTDINGRRDAGSNDGAIYAQLSGSLREGVGEIMEINAQSGREAIERAGDLAPFLAFLEIRASEGKIPLPGGQRTTMRDIRIDASLRMIDLVNRKLLGQAVDGVTAAGLGIRAVLPGVLRDLVPRLTQAAMIEACGQPIPEPETIVANPLVEETQRLLNRLEDYDVGPPDGLLNDMTRIEIQRFQAEQNMAVDGRVSAALIVRLKQVQAASSDKRGPEIDIPEDRMTIERDQVVIAGMVRDDSGVSNVRVSGSPVVPEPDGSFTEVVDRLDVGLNEIRVDAIDQYGNASQKVVVVERLAAEGDASPPKIEVEADAFETAAEAARIRGTVSDDRGGLTVTANGQPVSLNGDGTFSHLVDPLAEGVNRVTLRAIDAADNASSLEVVITRRAGASPEDIARVLSELTSDLWRGFPAEPPLKVALMQNKPAWVDLDDDIFARTNRNLERALSRTKEAPHSVVARTMLRGVILELERNGLGGDVNAVVGRLLDSGVADVLVVPDYVQESSTVTVSLQAVQVEDGSVVSETDPKSFPVVPTH